MLSNQTKQKIITTIYEPEVYRTINEFKNRRRLYEFLSTTFEITSNILVGLSGIVAFSSNQYENKQTPYYAGIMSGVAIFFKVLSNQFMAKANKADSGYAKLLQKFHIIDDIPIDQHLEETDENNQTNGEIGMAESTNHIYNKDSYTAPKKVKNDIEMPQSSQPLPPPKKYPSTQPVYSDIKLSTLNENSIVSTQVVEEVEKKNEEEVKPSFIQTAVNRVFEVR